MGAHLTTVWYSYSSVYRMYHDESLMRMAMQTPEVASDPAKVRVLLLGGWSSGPLDHLRRAFRDECVFIEPPLHTPPAGVRWCCTVKAALLFSTIWLGSMLLGSNGLFGWPISSGLRIALLCRESL